MKRTVKYALSAVLSAAMVSPAFAQNQGYSDVPENHWAYEALVRLKNEGLLVGYPDGEFKGKRLTTRYELASAIYAVYTNLKNITDSLDSQIKALQAGGRGGDGGADIQALKDQIAALRSDVDTLKGYGDEIATLKRLTDSFQKELQSLGVDVEAMKKDIADLQDRVTRLENNKPTIAFSGDANLFASVGFGAGDGVNKIGVNQDGRVFGFNRTSPNAAGLEDLSVIHDIGLTFAGTNETGPKFKGTIAIGNAYNGSRGPGLGNQSDYAGFVNSQYSEAESSLFIQNLEVEFPTSLAGIGLAAKVGRLGYRVNPQILQRIDTTSFYKNERWDNGMFAVDGVTLGFGFAGGRFEGILARTGNQYTTASGGVFNFQRILVGGEQGSFLSLQNISNPLPSALNVQRLMGATFSTNIARNRGKVNASYLLMDGDNYEGSSGASGQPINRAEVFGGDVAFGFSKLKVNGSFQQSNFKADNGRALTTNNQFWSAGANYSGDRFGLFGGYRYIEAFYFAPGDWGRYGLIRNPTNVQGYNVGGSFRFTDALSLNGTYENLEQILNGDGRIEKYQVNLAYDLPSGLKLLGGYEETRFKNFATLNDPRYRFVTAGVGYNLSSATTFSLTYQYGDVNNDFVIANARGTAGNFKGSFFASQLSVKF